MKIAIVAKEFADGREGTGALSTILLCKRDGGQGHNYPPRLSSRGPLRTEGMRITRVSTTIPLATPYAMRHRHARKMLHSDILSEKFSTEINFTREMLTLYRPPCITQELL